MKQTLLQSGSLFNGRYKIIRAFSNTESLLIGASAKKNQIYLMLLASAFFLIFLVAGTILSAAGAKPHIALAKCYASWNKPAKAADSMDCAISLLEDDRTQYDKLSCLLIWGSEYSLQSRQIERSRQLYSRAYDLYVRGKLSRTQYGNLAGDLKVLIDEYKKRGLKDEAEFLSRWSIRIS